MKAPYLVPMSVAAFEDIPNKVVPRTVRLKDPDLQGDEATEWIFSGYCDKFLYKNENLQNLFQQFAGEFDTVEFQSCLTQGQRFCLSLGALDGQVKNGGITQFFWNCSDLIFEAKDSLELLDESELAESYNRVLGALIGKKEDWIELRKQARNDPNNFWEPFQKSYDLLELSWFDDAYFKTYGPTLLTRLVNYVRSHKGEFIES